MPQGRCCTCAPDDRDRWPAAASEAYLTLSILGLTISSRVAVAVPGKINMNERQQRVVVYLPDVEPSYPAAAREINRARCDPEQAARNNRMARMHGLGPVLHANPGSIAVNVLESEARLDIEPAAIASNVILRVLFGGEGSRPPPGFGKRVAPQDHRAKRKAA